MPSRRTPTALGNHGRRVRVNGGHSFVIEPPILPLAAKDLKKRRSVDVIAIRFGTSTFYMDSFRSQSATVNTIQVLKRFIGQTLDEVKQVSKDPQPQPPEEPNE